ncbi:MAG: SUF system Fe-S cluster assembly regulator [Pseudomonadota bacterium]
MSKMTDYGTLVLAELAATTGDVLSASDISQSTRLGLPSVRKLLKMLCKAGIVVSFRGASGGYALARSPHNISAADILEALEGPLLLTACSASDSQCELEQVCGVGKGWKRVNQMIRRTLNDVSLAQLCDAETIPSDVPRSDDLTVHGASRSTI